MLWCSLQSLQARRGDGIHGMDSMDLSEERLQAEEFQRCVNQWHNTAADQRKAKVSSWASQLQGFKNDAPESLRSLRSLILQLAAALSPPRVAGSEWQSQNGQDDVEAPSRAFQVDQKAIKKTLLEALALWRSFDLEDSEIEPVRNRVEYLVQKFEECHASIDCAASCSLWRRLKEACGAQADPTSSNAMSKRHRSGKRSTVKETYSPGENRAKLKTIVHKPSEPKVLRCDRCSYELVSCWYFVHPTKHSTSVLVPNNGHTSCRGVSRAGGRPSGAFFRPIDGSPYKADCSQGLDYCIHNRVRAICAPCGGVNVCRHRMPKWQCSKCKLTIRKRIKKVTQV